MLFRKKALLVLMASMLLITAACNGSEAPEPSPSPAQEEAPDETETPTPEIEDLDEPEEDPEPDEDDNYLTDYEISYNSGSVDDYIYSFFLFSRAVASEEKQDAIIDHINEVSVRPSPDDDRIASFVFGDSMAYLMTDEDGDVQFVMGAIAGDDLASSYAAAALLAFEPVIETDYAQELADAIIESGEAENVRNTTFMVRESSDGYYILFCANMWAYTEDDFYSDMIGTINVYLSTFQVMGDVLAE